MNKKVLVFVKQVPDTQNITGDAMTPEGTVNRAALPAVFNPEDLNALELALQLKERYGVHVTVATMGMPAAAEVLRASLYRGADRAILLTDRALAGADTLATSYTLSCCVKKLGDIDLVLCGRQAIDGDTAQVGPQIAEKLAIPQLCYVEEVKDLDDKNITVRRAIEGGYEILQAPMPALLTVIDANDPRPMNAHNIMRFKNARTKSEVARPAGQTPLTPEEAAAKTAELEKAGLLIEEWNAADVNAAPERIGFAGSPTKVKQVMSVVLTASEAKQIEPTEAGINELIHELITDHTLG